MSAAEPGLWGGRRIGLLGGTFDPPHEGHVGMARHARAALGLDRVLFSVAPRPPHKSATDTTPFVHRLEMVRRAIGGDDALAVTRIEEDNGVSFTVDLLRACRSRTDADLYLIIGADSLVELPAWREPEEILRMATVVVFARDDAALRLEVAGSAALVVFEQPKFEVSSTSVRRRLASGEPAAGLLAADVASYIVEHALYRQGA